MTGQTPSALLDGSVDAARVIVGMSTAEAPGPTLLEGAAGGARVLASRTAANRVVVGCLPAGVASFVHVAAPPQNVADEIKLAVARQRDPNDIAVPLPTWDGMAKRVLEVYLRIVAGPVRDSKRARKQDEATPGPQILTFANPGMASQATSIRRMKGSRALARRALTTVGLCILIMLIIPVVSPQQTTVEFVSRNLTELHLNGGAFRFTGLNIPDATGAPCWHPIDLNKSLDVIGHGQDVARVYAFQRTATTNTGRDWTYIDRMLSIFHAHGQRVIMVLTDQWRGQPCTDSASDRTLAWYQGGYRTTIEGATTYREWVSQAVGRYREDPTIALWQLVNEGEARNADGTCSESTAREALRAFAEDIGTLVKSLDSHHLVSLGTTSGECGSNEADYGYIHAATAIDVCDYHDYGFNTSAMSNTDTNNGLQISIVRCHAAGKALFVGEVGIDYLSLNPATTAQRATLFRAKLTAQFSAGSTGELIWRWSPTFHPEQGLEVAPGDPAIGLLTAY